MYVCVRARAHLSSGNDKRVQQTIRDASMQGSSSITLIDSKMDALERTVKLAGRLSLRSVRAQVKQSVCKTN